MLIGYDVFMEVLDRQKRRNRAKRMRDARQDRKIARLRKLANREDIICQAVASGCVSREEIEHILHADSGEEHIYYSRTPTVQGRIEYLEMLISKYSEIDFSKMETLEGIMIATTNLTCNLDKAFERRFIYKIEFERPTIEAKKQIWKSMIPSLSEDMVYSLAKDYDLSGGQIENIARKRTVEEILSGETPNEQQMHEYCQSEVLHSNRDKRAKIGFR